MKKLIALLLSVVSVLAMNSFGTVSAERVLIPEDENIVPSTVLSKEVHNETSSKYDEIEVIPCSLLENESNTAKEFINSGAVLVILEPTISGEEVAELLSIPVNKTTTYQHQVLLAYSVFKFEDEYIISSHYAVFGKEKQGSPLTRSEPANMFDEYTAPASLSDSNLSDFSKVILLKDYMANNEGSIIFDFDIVAETALASANRIRQKAHVMEVDDACKRTATKDANFPSTIATQTWNSTLGVYGPTGLYYGYLNCTVYAYYKGLGVVNNETMKIYDVLSFVEAYPRSNAFTVDKYDTLLHCNVTNFLHLQSANLLSGVSYSGGVSLSGSYGSQGGTGGVSYTTGWTYNPESQNITRTSPAPRVIKWQAKTVSPTAGKSYDVAPGIRVASPLGYMRGAFCRVYCDTVFLGITLSTNEIEVGGWF